MIMLILRMLVVCWCIWFLRLYVRVLWWGLLMCMFLVLCFLRCLGDIVLVREMLCLWIFFSGDGSWREILGWRVWEISVGSIKIDCCFGFCFCLILRWGMVVCSYWVILSCCVFLLKVYFMRIWKRGVLYWGYELIFWGIMCLVCWYLRRS